ncbi:lipopolysaccharide biosynthesis protein [Sulfobacillus thermosulfidooxidans]|uniref:lipopolysaccharide biosynthesis protein n=1 Tax=Sulfobacillus thermosulfidooxidans TaxID=28034 RepID=UPI0006B444CC|nr:capsular biosynthesis protein [Sulfobacillus thermosulfidooxidans]
MAKFKAFWEDNLIFGLATLLAGVFNYLYHVVLAHVLGPRLYGDLATFLNVTTFMVIPASVVTLIYTRMGKDEGHNVYLQSLGLWTGGLSLWVVIWVARGMLAHLFDVNPTLLVVFTAEVVPSLALAANVGMLQRGRWYLWVGLLGILNTGFRVIAAGGALWSGYRLTAVGILEGIAAWVTWYVSRVMTTHVPLKGEETPSGVIVGTAIVGIINVLFALVDGLAAKYALSPVAAGQYTGLATIGHSLQFVSGSLGTVMLTAVLADPIHRYRYAAMTVGLYGMLAAIGEWLFVVYGHNLVLMVLGKSFFPVVPWLAEYGWGMICLGFLNIAMLYSVARRRWEVVLTTGVGLLYWIWALVHDHTLGRFVVSTTHIMFAIMCITVIAMAVTQVFEMRLKVRPQT